MNRICIAALTTVMICGSGCGPSEQERLEATHKLFSVLKYDDKGGSLGDSIRRGETIRVLIEAGADVNARDLGGMTPLMFASYKSTTSVVVTLLIEAGADVNAKTNGGKTALTYADYKDDTQVIRILKAAGAKE